MNRLRSVARIAILAMAWAALLPFSASARMLAIDGPVEHCHKLSIDGATDPDPANSDGPSQPRKVSCPFCAAAAAATAPAPVALPCFVRAEGGAAAPPHVAPPPCGTEVALPLSRGPPAAGRR